MSEALSPEELESLIRRRGAALRMFAAQWTSAADDAVQEAFIRLMQQRPKPANPVGWLFRAVRNQALTMRRSGRRRQSHEVAAGGLRVAANGDDAPQPFEAQEVWREVQGLDGALREVVVARVWGGLGFEELGEVLGVSTATAFRRYRQALSELRNRLETQCLSDPGETTR